METPFRPVDAQIGRMWGVDAMAEAAFEFSPFAYAFNNPIMLNDPSGLFPLAAFADYENERKKEGMVTAEDRGNGGQKTPPTIHVLLMENRKSDKTIANDAWAVLQSYLESNKSGEPVYFNFKITSLKKIKINEIKKNDALIIVGDNRVQIIDLVASWGGEYKQWTSVGEVKKWRNWKNTDGKDDFPEVSNNPSVGNMPKNINIGVIDRNTTIFMGAEIKGKKIAGSPELIFMHILGHNSGLNHANKQMLPFYGIMNEQPNRLHYKQYYVPSEENKSWKQSLKQHFGQ